MPALDDIRAARDRIGPHLHKTPVLTSHSLNSLVGAELFFKCENFQKTGAFKARGAANAVLCAERPSDGFLTHSSGNHGAALAWASRLVGAKATVVVPENARREKLESMRRYGARLVLCGTTLDSREAALAQVAAEGDFLEIPPYDHFDVVSGQGTCAMELLEQAPDLDQLWMPVGGGGLAAGSAIAADGSLPIIGVEPELARDAYDSLQCGRRLPPHPPRTIADGLRTSLGRLNFRTLQHHGARIALASEKGIEDATTLIWYCLKILVEPSSAVVLAAMLENPQLASGRVGVILSGGNVLPVLPHFQPLAGEGSRSCVRE